MKYLVPVFLTILILGCRPELTEPGTGEKPYVSAFDPVERPIAPPKGTLSESSAWSRASTLDNPSAYQWYIKHYPEGAHLSEAESRLRELEAEYAYFKDTGAATSSAGYQKYKERYPNGSLGKEWPKSKGSDIQAPPRTSEEDLIWSATIMSHTKQGYEKFLQEYPNSKHAAKAQVQLKLLNAQAESRANGSGSETKSPNNTSKGETGSGNTDPIDVTSGIDSLVNPQATTDTIPASEAESKPLKGQMAYRLDTLMTVNKPSKVALIIWKNKSLSEMKLKVVEITDTEGEITRADTTKVKVVKELRIAEYMSAKLKSLCGDDSFFKIESPLENPEQRIDLEGGTPTIWYWYVTPQKEGNCILDLSVFIPVKEGTKTSTQMIPVFGKKIRVEADGSAVVEPIEPKPVPPLGFWDLYKWPILGLLGLLLLGLLFFFLRRKRKEETVAPHNFYLKKGEMDTVRKLVGKGDLKKALALMETSLKDNHPQAHREILLHQASLSTTVKERQLDLLSPEEAKRTQNQITFAILKLIDELEG